MAKSQAPKSETQTPANTARATKRPCPKFTLEESLVIVNAIGGNNGKPLDRLLLADAIRIKPSSSDYRDLLSSSRSYGLTVGTEKAETIQPTELGISIISPNNEDERSQAIQRAVLSIESFNKVLQHFNRGKLPQPEFFKNMLVRQFQIPAEWVAEFERVFTTNCEFAGFIRNISGSPMVMLNPGTIPIRQVPEEKPNQEDVTNHQQNSGEALLDSDQQSKPQETAKNNNISSTLSTQTGNNERYKRVFITHGKNKAFIAPLKGFLTFGELVPVVAVENSTISQPIPDKVMSEMRSCGAAIIHVEDEQRLINSEGVEQPIINPNVLIEIGAAMALYGRRFILLVKEGVTLPSNLQGLFEVRYNGDSLDSDATVRLLNAIKDMKAQPLPE